MALNTADGPKSLAPIPSSDLKAHERLDSRLPDSQG